MPRHVEAAGGGAPKGNRNALKQGLYAAEVIETRRMIAALTKQAHEVAASLPAPYPGRFPRPRPR